jgi:hypothetical protein
MTFEEVMKSVEIVNKIIDNNFWPGSFEDSGWTSDRGYWGTPIKEDEEDDYWESDADPLTEKSEPKHLDDDLFDI